METIGAGLENYGWMALTLGLTIKYLIDKVASKNGNGNGKSNGKPGGTQYLEHDRKITKNTADIENIGKNIEIMRNENITSHQALFDKLDALGNYRGDKKRGKSDDYKL